MKEKINRIMYIAFPIIVQGIVFQLQSLTDKAMLGNMKSIYISSLGAAQFPLNTTLDSIMALGIGLIIYVSRLYGAGEKECIKGYVKSFAFYSTGISIIVFFIWFVFTNQILEILNVDSAIIGNSAIYIKICSFYIFFIGMDTALQGMLQGIGNTKPIMVAGVTKVLLNIIISYLLIFGKMGFPKLNIVGAAVGTLVANLISVMILFIYCFIIKKHSYHLHLDKKSWINTFYFKKMVALGIPTAMEYFLWNASNLVLLGFLNGFSYLATAIYTLTFGIEIVIYAFFNSTSKATMTLMGQSVGAKNRREANEFLFLCMALNTTVVLTSIAVFLCASGPILSIFTKDSTIISSAKPFLIFTGFIMIPKSLNVVIGNGIRAYGETKWMMYSQIIGSVFVVLCSFLLIEILHFDMIAIYMTLLFDELIRASINFAYFIRKHTIKNTD